MDQNPIQRKSRIAIDAMGGDFAPFNAVMGAIDAFEDSDFELFLVGQKEEIVKILSKENKSFDENFIIDAPEIIHMSESPTNAIKKKRKSSIVVGSNLVKDGKADAFVSAGNTGAVSVAAIFEIGRIKGVSRPTLTAPLPNSKDGFTFLTDVGAFVDSKPKHLLDYAKLSSVFIEEVYGIKSPKVGLLNVGEEDEKGYQLTTETGKLLKESKLNFIGNVEGKDIFKGTADLVVCDGFIGNILLKFAESMPGFLKAAIKNYADKGLANKLRVSPFKFPPTKQAFKDSLSKADPDNVGGLPLLGIDGISIIGHGGSTRLAIKNMILQAKAMQEKDLITKIKDAIK